MTDIRLEPKGDEYVLIRKDNARPFMGEFLRAEKGGYVPVKYPLGISAVEKKLLDRYGNIVIAQNQWQIWNMGDGEYIVDRY